MGKILYVASTVSHLRSFHLPYIEALQKAGHTVMTMANGEGADINVPFEKKFFSRENAACRKMIRAITDRESFDLIILNTSLAAFHTRLAIRNRARARVINIMHGYLFPRAAKGSLRERVKRLMLLFAERLVRKKTDTVITMNREDTEIALKYKLSGGTVRECRGMGVKIPDVRKGRDEIRRELGDEDSFVMLFVGEYSARKNQEYLISLLPKIKETCKSAVLWLVGEGDSRDMLDEYARSLGVRDSVKLLGRRDNAVDYMRAADVYVSAAKSEGLPFNIVEALGVGCRVVASDVKGQRDILEGGGGILFPLEDSSEAIRAITSVQEGKDSSDPSKIAEAYSTYAFENVFENTLGLILSEGFPSE